MSTPGVFLAGVYATALICTTAYTILFVDRPTDPVVLVLLVLLLPWVLVATPLVIGFPESDLPLLMLCALANIVLMYRIGKKLSRYFSA